MNCPVCDSSVKDCSFCKKKQQYVIPETLIKVIHNVNHIYTKEQRDNALIQLTQQCKYFLKKNVTYFYHKYSLAKKDYEYNDFHQDVLLEFYDLVINDFKIKAPDDNTLAYFGNYIKHKLYYRIQYSLQEKLKKFGWVNEVNTNFQIESNGIAGDQLALTREVHEATLSLITNSKKEELDHIQEEKCTLILKKIYEISFNEKVCSQIEAEIWRLYWFGGKSTEQINESLFQSRQYKTKLGETKIYCIIKKINQKIIAEFGRLTALGEYHV